MGTFHELEEFERRFDAMDVAEKERWKQYDDSRKEFMKLWPDNHDSH